MPSASVSFQPMPEIWNGVVTGTGVSTAGGPFGVTGGAGGPGSEVGTCGMVGVVGGVVGETVASEAPATGVVDDAVGAGTTPASTRTRLPPGRIASRRERPVAETPDRPVEPVRWGEKALAPTGRTTVRR